MKRASGAVLVVLLVSGLLAGPAQSAGNTGTVRFSVVGRDQAHLDTHTASYLADLGGGPYTVTYTEIRPSYIAGHGANQHVTLWAADVEATF